MKSIKKISAIFLSFCIVCSAIFVMTAIGNQTVNAVNDSTDNVVLQQGFESGSDWVKVEKTFTATRGQIMIIYMKPTDYTNLAGTKVYIDDIIVKETSTNTEALNQTFENAKDTAFYVTDSQVLNNGFAPNSNISNDPRIAGLATSNDGSIGYNGSNNAIQLGYVNNPDDNTKKYLPMLRVRGSKTYNGRDNGLALKLISGKEYTISFYYKAVGVNAPFGLYVAETDTGLSGYQTPYNNASAINSQKITDVTASTVGKDAIFYDSTKYTNGVAPQVSNNIPNDPRKVCLANGTGVGNNSNTAMQLGYTANPDSTNKGGLPIIKVRNSETYNGKTTDEAFRFEAGETYNISFYYKAVGVNTPLGLYVSEYKESLQGYRAGFSTSTAAQKSQKINDISASTTGWVKVETTYTSADGQDMVIYMKPTDYTNLAGTTIYIDDVTVTTKDTTPPPVEDNVVLKQGFEDEGIAEYYSKAENGYHNDYRSVELVTGDGIGNNGSNTAIKIGFGRDFTSNDERNNKPAFNVSSTMEYNGRKVGESFRFKKGVTYKLSFYYKVVSCNFSGQFQLWANQIKGSLDTTTVDLLDATAYLKLVNNFSSATTDYVYVETEITAKDDSDYDLVFMIRQLNNNVVGTTIYIDDITVKSTEVIEDDDIALNADFENSDGNDELFYNTSSDKYGNGYAPVAGSNNIPNDPRKTCWVDGTGVGNNSNGALQFGYVNNPDNTNKNGHPVFKMHNSKTYNGRQNYQSFRFEAEKTYNISFYYNAVGVNAPLQLYVSEYNESLAGYNTHTGSTIYTRSVKLTDISTTTSGWVKVEVTYTSAVGEDMVLFMKPTDYTNLAGTTVYIDDVVVKIDKKIAADTDNSVLLATFEDVDSKDTNFYSGDSGMSSGVAPITGSNNIPNDPRLTCLVKGTGVGYNDSNGAMHLGYLNDPSSNNQRGVPIFRVRSSEIYNGRSDTQPFAFKAGEVYTLSFYYKAEGINNPIELLFSEYKDSLSGYRADALSTVGTRAIKLADINESTDGWVKVEYTFTSNYGENLVIYLNPTVFINLAGTKVYIDDISLTLPTGLPKISFDTKGAVAIGKQTVRPGYEFGYLPVPSRSGYAFEGWYNQDYTVAYSKNMICPDDIDGKTFYAKWSKVDTQPKSFSTSFEEEEYTAIPYFNDGVNQLTYNNMTKTSSWFKEAEQSYSGGAAVRIINAPFLRCNNLTSNGFSLVNGDGSRFNVVKGQRYKIKFYYYAIEPVSAHSYISAIISSNVSAENVNYKDQLLFQKAVHGVSSDWDEVEATFEANVTGYVYITLSGRNSTSIENSEGHTVYVDNVSIDLLDSNYVKVNYYDGNTLKNSTVGKKNDKLLHPILDVKAGYEFVGWFTDAECTNPAKDVVYPSEDKNYYAKYEVADYSGAVASDISGKTLSFEENEFLDAFYGTKQRITYNIEDIGREIEFVKNDPKNARTGNNYIKLIEIDTHHKYIGFSLYDLNNKNGDLYLEPGETYYVSYWVLPDIDAFSTIQFSVALTDVSNTLLDVTKPTKIEPKFFEPADCEPGEWINITHTVTNTSDKLMSLAIVTPNTGASCFVDDISIDKVTDVEIKFDSNGGTDVEPLIIKTYSIIEVFFEPMRDGYEFVGWCVDKELTKLFDFDNTIVTGPMTLYAKWKADDLLIGEEEETDEQASNEQVSNFDELDNFDEEKIDNGERPNIMDADPINTTSNSNDKVVKEDSNLSIFEIVVIVCGGVVLIASIVLLVLLLVKKRKNKVIGG